MVSHGVENLKGSLEVCVLFSGGCGRCRCLVCVRCDDETLPVVSSGASRSPRYVLNRPSRFFVSRMRDFAFREEYLCK